MVVGQFGERAQDDVAAFGSALVLGYAFEGAWQPSLGVEWTFASGDDDPTDGEYGTFDPLFPFGHAYQGFLDIFAWRNGHDSALRFSVKPDEDYWLEIAVHAFILDSETDAWYGANGLPIRRVVAGGVDEFVGTEVDLHCRYTLNAATKLWFGYSHFFSGDFVEDSGASPDTDWLWFQMTVTF